MARKKTRVFKNFLHIKNKGAQNMSVKCLHFFARLDKRDAILGGSSISLLYRYKLFVVYANANLFVFEGKFMPDYFSELLPQLIFE